MFPTCNILIHQIRLDKAPLADIFSKLTDGLGIRLGVGGDAAKSKAGTA